MNNARLNHLYYFCTDAMGTYSQVSPHTDAAEVIYVYIPVLKSQSLLHLKINLGSLWGRPIVAKTK